MASSARSPSRRRVIVTCLLLLAGGLTVAIVSERARAWWLVPRVEAKVTSELSARGWSCHSLRVESLTLGGATITDVDVAGPADTVVERASATQVDVAWNWRSFWNRPRHAVTDLRARGVQLTLRPTPPTNDSGGASAASGSLNFSLPRISLTDLTVAWNSPQLRVVGSGSIEVEPAANRTVTGVWPRISGSARHSLALQSLEWKSNGASYGVQDLLCSATSVDGQLLIDRLELGDLTTQPLVTISPPSDDTRWRFDGTLSVASLGIESLEAHGAWSPDDWELRADVRCDPVSWARHSAERWTAISGTPAPWTPPEPWYADGALGVASLTAQLNASEGRVLATMRDLSVANITQPHALPDVAQAWRNEPWWNSSMSAECSMVRDESGWRPETATLEGDDVQLSLAVVRRPTTVGDRAWWNAFDSTFSFVFEEPLLRPLMHGLLPELAREISPVTSSLRGVLETDAAGVELTSLTVDADHVHAILDAGWSWPTFGDDVAQWTRALTHPSHISASVQLRDLSQWPPLNVPAQGALTASISWTDTDGGSWALDGTGAQHGWLSRRDEAWSISGRGEWQRTPNALDVAAITLDDLTAQLGTDRLTASNGSWSGSLRSLHRDPLSTGTHVDLSAQIDSLQDRHGATPWTLAVPNSVVDLLRAAPSLSVTAGATWDHGHLRIREARCVADGAVAVVEGGVMTSPWAKDAESWSGSVPFEVTVSDATPFLVPLRSIAPELEGFAQAHVAGRVDTRGLGEATVSIDSLTGSPSAAWLQLGISPVIPRVEAALSFDGTDLRLTNSTWTLEDGSVQASGTWNVSEATARGVAVTLGDVRLQRDGWRSIVSGEVELETLRLDEAHLTGTSSVGRAALALERCVGPSLPATHATVDASWTPERATLHALHAIPQTGAEVTTRGWFDWTAPSWDACRVHLDGTFRYDTSALPRSLQTLGSAGPADGWLTLDGTAAAPAVSLHGRLQDLQFTQVQPPLVVPTLWLDAATLDGQLRVQLRSDSGALPFAADATLTPTTHNVRGWLNPDVTAKASIQLEQLDPWLAEVRAVQSVSGAVHAEWVPGTRLLDGAVDVSLDDVVVRGTRDTVRTVESLRGGARIDRSGYSNLDIRGARAAAPFHLTGEGTWDGDAFVRAESDGCLLLRERDVRLRGNVDVTLQRSAGALRLSGEVALTDGKDARPVDLWAWTQPRSHAPAVQRGLEAFSIDLPPFDRMTLDVALKANKPFRISNNVARANLRPQLTLMGIGSDPRLDGSVYIDDASVSLPAASLSVEAGTLTFDPATPDIPQLQLSAETRMLGYDIQAVVTGPLDEPVITLSSSPPLEQEQLLLLVATGQPPSSPLDGDTGTRTLQSVATYLGKDLVTRWLSQGDSTEDAAPSLFSRLEVEMGRDQTVDGVDTIEARFLLKDNVPTAGGGVYLQGERSKFNEFNLGLRLVLRFR